MTLAARSRTAWVHAADLARSACGGGGAMGVVDDDRGGEGETSSQAGGTAGAAAAAEATEGMGCHGGDRCQDVRGPGSVLLSIRHDIWSAHPGV